jgi:hypothetical protein
VSAAPPLPEDPAPPVAPGEPGGSSRLPLAEGSIDEVEPALPLPPDDPHPLALLRRARGRG